MSVKNRSEKHYQNRKWETHLSEEDNEKANKILEFLYQNEILGKLSHYGLVKMMMEIAIELLYEDEAKKIIDTMNFLHENNIIKNKSFVDTFQYLIRIGHYCIDNNINLTGDK